MKPVVRVIAGERVIGGNCIAVSLNRDEYLIFDHGLRFDRFRKYYGFYTQPLGAGELRELGILPPLEIIAGAKETYVSHLHLDHLGSLDYLDLMEEEGPFVYVPLRDYYTEVLMEKWRYSWKTVLIPHLSSAKRRLNDVDDFKHVRPVKMFHSSYPSYAYVVETEEGVVTYTGDFRLKSLIKSLLNEYPILEEVYETLYGEEDYDPLAKLTEIDGSPDFLIIEGTNIGRLLTPLEPSDFAKITGRILANGPTIVSLHTFDLESLLAISTIAKGLGLTIYIYGSRLASYLSSVGMGERLLRELGLTYVGKKPLPVTRLEGVPLEEALRDLVSGRSVVITDYESVDIVRAVWKQPSSQKVNVILVVSEPHSEEYSIELNRHLAWFKLIGAQPYRVRVSGHYYPYEFSQIVEAIKPKKIVPVHTTFPEVVEKLTSGR